VNVLASFMSERATGNAFGSTWCVGSVGTSVGIGKTSPVFSTADTYH